MTEPIVIEFRGYASKKNSWTVRKNGKGVFIGAIARAAIERMELQIPGEYRDLRLEHPEMEWDFTYTNAHVDRDGIIVTVLDILQKYCIIVNDNIAHNNNRWIVNPAVRGEYDSVTVKLTPCKK